MPKYAPLASWLTQQPGHSIPMHFAAIEGIIGDRLPPSAHERPQWWENNRGHVQARAWLEAGWSTGDLDLAGQQVAFIRTTGQVTSSANATGTRSEGWAPAMSFPDTGPAQASITLI